MKKYLMTGIAALTLCAGFTSCSHDLEGTSPEDLAQYEALKVKANYDKAFVATFGQPAKKQTWGFGTTANARTREANVQGNLWHDSANMNLEYDAKVTTEEKNLVFNYVNNSKNVKTVDQISFENYWVAQIWNGNKDKNADGVQAPATTTYPNQNGETTTIVGGAQMDKLEILEAADTWTHCNNFNSADNTDWKEDGEGGRTLMINSGTLSFRYTNSQSSYLSEKYIIVPGEKIDPSLAGFYYVCFDFEKGYTDEEKAKETTYGTCEKWVSQPTTEDPDAGYWQSENWDLTGFYNDASSDVLKSTIEEAKNTTVRNIEIKGSLYGDKHCDGDGNYTDWIVRISPAVVKKSDVTSLRVMGEDLSATEESDFDFNDVVIDVERVDDTTAKIILQAAGGTLPLRIAGNDNWEVHKLFGVDTNIMVNTNWTGSNKATKSPVEVGTVSGNFTVENFNQAVKGIKLEVQKGDQWYELTAVQGEPASKFGCSTTKKWANERQSLTTATNFAQWVTGAAAEWEWY